MVNGQVSKQLQCEVEIKSSNKRMSAELLKGTPVTND